MATYSFHTKQLIPISIEQAWDFFSSPANLQRITPPEMRFQIISRFHGLRMYPGQLIEYKVRPFLGIPVYWMTEITQVQEPVYFIDQQRFGPYTLWHHQHHFKAIPGGVEMTDIVHYRIPLGILGDFANWLFVKQKLESIFQYRYKSVEELFGSWKQPG
jgi:ligand-binding SRPBCC domain-containing protein